jgi:hypothetical protein
MRAARFFLVPLLSALTLVAQESPLSGAWHRTRADDLTAAINAIVADMNFIKRPIARIKLTNLNTVYKDLVLTISNNEVSVKLDEREPIRMPTDGKPVPWKREDGEVLQASVQVGKDKLIQTLKNDDGQRTNVYELSPDGKTLTLSITVKSGKLPKPLTYTITFGRQ